MRDLHNRIEAIWDKRKAVEDFLADDKRDSPIDYMDLVAAYMKILRDDALAIIDEQQKTIAGLCDGTKEVMEKQAKRVAELEAQARESANHLQIAIAPVDVGGGREAARNTVIDQQAARISELEQTLERIKASRQTAADLLSKRVSQLALAETRIVELEAQIARFLVPWSRMAERKGE